MIEPTLHVLRPSVSPPSWCNRELSRNHPGHRVLDQLTMLLKGEKRYFIPNQLCEFYAGKNNKREFVGGRVLCTTQGQVVVG